MAIETTAEHTEPGPGRDDPFLEAQANAALEHWVQDYPAVGSEIQETIQTHVLLQELGGRANEADKTMREAAQRDATLTTRYDPGGYRVLGFGVGAALIVVLVVLDAIPLNWAAQAFDLNSAGTWLVTFILVVASVGAILGFEVTRRHPRQRGVLAGMVAVGYLALLGLRTIFLTTVAGESFPVAFLQAAMLTAISAGLVLCGSAVLARTRSLTLSRSRAAARRARRAAIEARTAQNQAAEKLQRHIGALRQILLPWALGSAAPADTDRAKWAAALERAIRQLFPAS